MHTPELSTPAACLPASSGTLRVSPTLTLCSGCGLWCTSWNTGAATWWWSHTRYMFVSESGHECLTKMQPQHSATAASECGTDIG
jgi:hypothetical protein